MKKLILVFGVLVFFLVSCSSEENNNSSSGFVNSISFHGDGTNGKVYNLEYTSDNKISKLDDGLGYKKEFFYTGDLITKVDFYAYCDCGPGTGPYTFAQSVMFTYDSQNRLTGFTITPYTVSYDTVEFNYVSNNQATYSAYNNGVLESSGTIYFDANNVNQKIVNVTSSGNNYTYEYNYFYDLKKHVFSSVKGYKNLMLFNVFLSSIFEDGIAPNYGTVNNVTSYKLKTYTNSVFSNEQTFVPFLYEYGNNGFPTKCNVQEQNIYMEYHF